MTGRRVVFWAGWIVAAAGVVMVIKHLQADTGETEPDKDPVSMPGVFVKLRQAKLSNGFVLAVPEGWEHGTYNSGVILRGPMDQGFMPNVHLYWMPARKNKPLRDWIEDQKRKRMGGGTTILHEQVATTAGMSGEMIVYETITTVRKGETLRTVTKDWLFGTADHVGILRGIAPGPLFVTKYQALFDEIHRRLRKPK